MSWRVHVILVQQLHVSMIYLCASEALAILEQVSHYVLQFIGYFIWDIITRRKILAKEVGQSGI